MLHGLCLIEDCKAKDEAMAQIDVELAAATRGTKAAACRYALLKAGYPENNPSLAEVKDILRDAHLTRACPFVDSQLESGLANAKHALDKRTGSSSDGLTKWGWSESSGAATDSNRDKSASTYSLMTENLSDKGSVAKTVADVAASSEHVSVAEPVVAQAVGSKDTVNTESSVSRNNDQVTAALAAKESEILNQIEALQHDLETVRNALTLLRT